MDPVDCIAENQPCFRSFFNQFLPFSGNKFDTFESLYKIEGKYSDVVSQCMFSLSREADFDEPRQLIHTHALWSIVTNFLSSPGQADHRNPNNIISLNKKDISVT